MVFRTNSSKMNVNNLIILILLTAFHRTITHIKDIIILPYWSLSNSVLNYLWRRNILYCWSHLGRGIDQKVHSELSREGAHSFPQVIFAKVPRYFDLPLFSGSSLKHKYILVHFCILWLHWLLFLSIVAHLMGNFWVDAVAICYLK